MLDLGCAHDRGLVHRQIVVHPQRFPGEEAGVVAEGVLLPWTTVVVDGLHVHGCCCLVPYQIPHLAHVVPADGSRRVRRLPVVILLEADQEHRRHFDDYVPGHSLGYVRDLPVGCYPVSHRHHHGVHVPAPVPARDHGLRGHHDHHGHDGHGDHAPAPAPVRAPVRGHGHDHVPVHWHVATTVRTPGHRSNRLVRFQDDCAIAVVLRLLGKH